MSIVRHIDSVPTIDLGTYFEALGHVKREDKLRVALAEAGCLSWDLEGRYIKSGSVALVGIGGVPISHDTLTQYRQVRSVIPGASAGMSYLNSGNKSLEQLYETVVDRDHFSVAHTAVANLLVAGVSSGVENEFNSQRDILHMSRLTVARTGTQAKPPIVVRDEELLEPTRRITEFIDEITGDIKGDDLDAWEARNLLYPSAKASLFLATASLRNFQKLVSQRSDRGKESEYRDTLGLIHDCLSTVWPELFAETP